MSENTRLRLNGEPPVDLLVFTSKLIFIPTVIALLMRRWVDVVVSSVQAISAIWFHSSHTRLSFYADQVGILLLAFHTLLLAITNNISICLFILAYGYMILVYSYGHYYKCFCFDSNVKVADKYHASIHIAGILIYSVSMLFIISHEANGIYSLMYGVVPILITPF